jgi:hypothetical protein
MTRLVTEKPRGIALWAYTPLCLTIGSYLT